MRDGSAVEVTALFEDTVIAVETLGRPPRPSWPLFAAGALALAVSAFAFASGVGVAARNQESADRWTGPSLAFREERLGAAWDGLAVAGLAGGLALVAWGFARRERKPTAYRLGGPGAELPMAGLELHPLVALRGEDYVFSRAPGMTGELTVNDVTQPLPEAHVLTRGARLRGTLGQNTFFVVAGSVSRTRVGAFLATLDERALAFAGLSAALHAAAVLLLLMIPSETRGLGADTLPDDLRRAAVTFRPREEPIPPPGAGGHQAGAEGAAAAAGDPGRLGKPNVQNDRGRPDEPARGGQRIAEATPVRARNAGILPILRAGDFGGVTSTGDLTNGFDDRDVVAWNGDAYADAGGWGLGPGGQGPGGGGRDPRLIGPGRYMTRPGPGPGGGYPWAPGGPGLPPRRPRPTFHIGQVVSPPEGLDPNLIRRYLRQRSDEITYCYEKELTVKPWLHGTSTARFAIDQGGRVLQAQVQGVSTEVDGCVADVLRRIQFPRSQNVYSITYPFVFRAAGM